MTTDLSQLALTIAEAHEHFSRLAARLKAKRLKGMSDTNLKRFRQFYQTYPQIGQTLSDQLPRSLPVPPVAAPAPGDPGVSPELLLSRLSFTRIVELLKVFTHADAGQMNLYL